MKSIIRTTLLAVLTTLALSSCEDFFETTIDIPPPEHEPQIVVSAFNQSPTLITALITQSIGIDELSSSDAFFLWGATVDVYRNDEYLQAMEQVGDENQFVEQYNYEIELDEALATGDVIRLEISYPDLPDASVTTIMPPAPTIVSVDYEENGGVTPDGREVGALDIRFVDEAGIAAFYEVAAIDSNDDQINNGYQMYLESTDPSASRSLEWNSLLISDISFDGLDKIVRVQADQLPFKQSGSVFLIVSSITEDHYNYSKAYRQQFDTGDNPFASPVQIPTVVQGGFGFFGLMNPVLFEIEF
jgi:hypothetical protein